MIKRSIHFFNAEKKLDPLGQELVITNFFGYPIQLKEGVSIKSQLYHLAKFYKWYKNHFYPHNSHIIFQTREP